MTTVERFVMGKITTSRRDTERAVESIAKANEMIQKVTREIERLATERKRVAKTTTWDLPNSDPLADIIYAQRKLMSGNSYPLKPLPSDEPETLSWIEVQKLLVGILRQVPDNKVTIHKTEFESEGTMVWQQVNDDETITIGLAIE